MGKPNRIQEFRKAKGLTLEGLAEAADLSPSYLSRMERGGRNVSLKNLGKIADALGVRKRDLVPNPATVPLVGYVGAGAATHRYAEAQGPFDEVPAPEGSTPATVAVEIRGDSLGSFFDRWLVFYDDVRDPPTSDLLGHVCVCGLADGRILIKLLKRGNLAGHYTLVSQFEPPIYDVILEWAARVKTMVPR